MSGPAWTTTYQVALGGGYGALTVDCVSALPDWSATTWFRARAMLPRWSQLPTWMCEIWDDEAWSPLIFSSTMVDPCCGVTMMVPAAVVVAGGAGAIGKVRPTGPDVGEGLGATDGLATTGGDELEWPPQATTHAVTATTANHFCADVNPSRHRVLALPQQVTGAGREWNPARNRFRRMAALGRIHSGRRPARSTKCRHAMCNSEGVPRGRPASPVTFMRAAAEGSCGGGARRGSPAVRRPRRVRSRRARLRRSSGWSRSCEPPG